jgi:hypothetical protein
MRYRTTLLVALRKTDLAAVEATKKQAFHLLHADVLSALPPGCTPHIAALYLPPSTTDLSSNSAWLKAHTSGEQALQALSSRLAGLGRAPPAAVGAVNTRALLEKHFVGRQQAAAQGMLSMLQLRCDGARNCFEVLYFSVQNLNLRHMGSCHVATFVFGFDKSATVLRKAQKFLFWDVRSAGKSSPCRCSHEFCLFKCRLLGRPKV